MVAYKCFVETGKAAFCNSAKWDQEAEKKPKDDILKSIANADEETLRKIKELLFKTA